MHIGLDFDGVLLDCDSLKTLGAKILFGKIIPPPLMKKHFLVGKGILTPDEYQKLKTLIYDNPEFIPFMEPVSGMELYLSKLLAEAHTVRVITSRPSADIPTRWLERRGLALTLVAAGGPDKSGFMGGLDAYVDDSARKLSHLKESVEHRILFAPKDSLCDAAVDNDVLRVRSWESLYCAVHALENAR